MRRKRGLRRLPAVVFKMIRDWCHKPATYVQYFDETLHLKQVQYTNSIYNYVLRSGGEHVQVRTV